MEPDPTSPCEVCDEITLAEIDYLGADNPQEEAMKSLRFCEVTYDIGCDLEQIVQTEEERDKAELLSINARCGYEILEISLFSLSLVLIACVLVFNTMLIAVILKHQTLRTATNKIIVSLAISDTVFALSLIYSEVMNILQRIAEMTYDYERLEYIISIRSIKQLCMLLDGPGIIYASMMASVLTLTSVTFEKYIAIFHPFHYYSIVTNRNIILSAVIIWTFSLIFGLIPLVWNTFDGTCLITEKTSYGYIVLWACICLACAVIILAMYTRIFLTARKQARAICARQSMFQSKPPTGIEKPRITRNQVTFDKQTDFNASQKQQSVSKNKSNTEKASSNISRRTDSNTMINYKQSSTHREKDEYSLKSFDNCSLHLNMNENQKSVSEITISKQDEKASKYCVENNNDTMNFKSGNDSSQTSQIREEINPRDETDSGFVKTDEQTSRKSSTDIEDTKCNKRKSSVVFGLGDVSSKDISLTHVSQTNNNEQTEQTPEVPLSNTTQESQNEATDQCSGQIRTHPTSILRPKPLLRSNTEPLLDQIDVSASKSGNIAHSIQGAICGSLSQIQEESTQTRQTRNRQVGARSALRRNRVAPLKRASTVTGICVQHLVEKPEKTQIPTRLLRRINTSAIFRQKLFPPSIRAVKTIAIILSVFYICWLPLLIYILAFKDRYSNLTINGLAMLALVNSMCNPLIYGFKNRGIRLAIRRLFRCKRSGRRASDSHSFAYETSFNVNH